MPQESLRKNPLWRAEDLGKPVPDTKHAVSVCLPRWRDVVGYEERDPATMEQLALGYPRFLYHPLVEQAFERFGGENAQIYTTVQAAERCRTYLLRKVPGADVEREGCVVRYPEDLAAHAKDYWQHAGEGISSRHAEALLADAPRPDDTAARNEITTRLAEFTGANAEDIYLFPTGMAAIYALLLATQQFHPNRPSVQFAFPYGDTLKLQDKMGDFPARFFARGDAEDLRTLEEELAAQKKVSGLFCEFPTNPLLSCVDLDQLRKLADVHDFPLLIDDTLAACVNLDVLPFADATAVSLTKFFSGTSDVTGGAVILNTSAPYAARLKAALATFHEPEAFYPGDVIQLAEDSRCCRARVETINTTTLEICEFLQAHPAVESVYYPAFTDKEIYDRYRRPDGGYGGLFSFVMKDAEKVTEKLYDALEITKGPNLGTSFSLCCPFTLIAHYDELEWAESAGASRWLIRISVGTEPADELIARIDRAIAGAI